MKKLKVFHGLVNYGTQAGLLAKELRNQGVESLSVAREDQYKRLIDIELKRGSGYFTNKIIFLLNTLKSISWFFQYNTFHFYYGTTLFPKQLDLPFYKQFGKKVIFHYLGKDVKLYKISVEKYKISNMAYSSGTYEEAITKDIKKIKRLNYETKYADLQIVCSPIYSEFVPNSIFIPLAIDLSKYEFYPKALSNPLKIIHAPTSRPNKGTEFIENAVTKLIKEGFKIDFKIYENIKHKDLLEKYKECDLFIDQVLGGYGTAAIEAMAIGRPTISYLRDIHFKESTFPGGLPIIRAHRDNIYEVLKDNITHKEILPEIGKRSRKFVEEFHDVQKLTNKLIDIYQKQVWNK